MIAYFFTVHKNISQFEKLFESVYDSENYYLIHLDKRSIIDDHIRLNQLKLNFSNVFLLEEQYVNWGRWSLVDVTLNAIDCLLNIGDWTHFINLSGQDFPLRSQSLIKEFLNNHKNNNFMQVFHESDFPAIRLRQQYFNWEDDKGITYTVGERKPFETFFDVPVILYGGSNWTILNRDFCNYLIYDDFSYKLQSYFKHTYIPDESFFQTALMSSPFKNSLINDHKRYIVMNPENNAAHPYIWTIKDIDHILSSNAFFSRKFDVDIDRKVIDVLCEEIQFVTK